MAIAGAIRFGGAGIADVEQFGIEIQHPGGERELRVRQDGGAHADFRAAGAHHRIDAIGRGHAVGGIDRDRGAARVVLVEAAAGIDEKFRVGPRPEHEREFGAGDAVAGGAAVRVEIAVDVELGAVEPQAGDHAQPVGGLQLLLDEEAESQALHGILADGRTAHATFGEIEPDLADVVEAGFDAGAELAGQAADRDCRGGPRRAGHRPGDRRTVRTDRRSRCRWRR